MDCENKPTKQTSSVTKSATFEVAGNPALQGKQDL